MNLKPAQLTVPREGQDPVTVDARVIAPGLYIHPTAPVEDGSPSDRWRITHHSGRLIAHFPSEGQAVRAGGVIKHFADWELSDDELHTAAQDGDIDLYVLGEVIDAHGGTLVRQRVILDTDIVRALDLTL